MGDKRRSENRYLLKYLIFMPNKRILRRQKAKRLVGGPTGDKKSPSPSDSYPASSALPYKR